MKFYYRTSAENIAGILECGFEHATELQTLQGDEASGIRVSDRPPDPSESAAGNTVLQFELKIPKSKLENCKVKPTEKHYQEWRFPAIFLNGIKPTIAKNIVEEIFQAACGKGELTAQLMAAFWTRYFQVRWLEERLRRKGGEIAEMEKLEKKYQGVELTYTRAMIQQIARAIKSGNASYLHDFANAIEEQGRNRLGRDPVRVLVAGLKLAGGKPRTIARIKQTLEANGDQPGSTRHLYDVCDEIGYAYTDGQEGRPPKETVKRPSK